MDVYNTTKSKILIVIYGWQYYHPVQFFHRNISYLLKMVIQNSIEKDTRFLTDWFLCKRID